MRILRKLFAGNSRTRISEAREQRTKQIEEMGLTLVDESGWRDGRYEPKRYMLQRNGENVAGPFHSSSEAFRAAREISRSN